MQYVSTRGGNTPQDMFSYEKNGKPFILMTTVRNNKVAVGAIGPGRALDLRAIDQSGGSRRVSGSDFRRAGDIHGLTFCRHFQRQV